MAVTPVYDLGGLGRLADMKFKKRAEEREQTRLGLQERAAEQNYRLGELQIQQTESNLQKIKRQTELRSGLSKILQNMPEGENQFTTAYSYFMMQGEPETATKYMDGQSDKIEQIYKMDPEAGIEAYNKTIGRVTGNTLKYKGKEKVYGDVFEAVGKDGKKVFLQKTNKGFEPIKDYTPPADKKTKSDYDMDFEDKLTKEYLKEGISETDARIKAKERIADIGSKSKTDYAIKFEDDITKEYMKEGLSELDARIKAKEKIAGIGKDKKDEVTKEKALSKISSILKSMATLEKSDMVTQLLAKDNPELAKIIGQKIDPDMKAALMKAWNEELDYLEQFSGTKRNDIKTGGDATHIYIPGKGIVPVTE